MKKALLAFACALAFPTSGCIDSGTDTDRQRSDNTTCSNDATDPCPCDDNTDCPSGYVCTPTDTTPPPWAGVCLPLPPCENNTDPNCVPPPPPGCNDTTDPNCVPPPPPPCDENTDPNCAPPPDSCDENTDPNCP
jgi:hypothetical protein